MNRTDLAKTLRIALGSLMHQKLRSLLSVLGVVCGVMAVVAMISIGEGAKRETIRQIEQLGTRNIFIRAVAFTREQAVKAREGLSQGLTVADLRRIENGCDTVEKIASLREVRASMIGLPRELTPQVVACSANYAELLGVRISAGRFIAPQDLRSRNLVCVLGSEVARQLEGLGQPGQFIRIADNLFKVVGILTRIEHRTGDAATVSTRNYNEMVFVPQDTAGVFAESGPEREKTAGSPEQLSEIVIRVTHTRDVSATARLVERIMDVAHHHIQDFQVVVPLELLRQARRTQRTFNLVLGAIAAISLLVGGIGIMNIMLATVSERTREIGIRRAVGATRKHILVQFLLEAVMLTVSGGVIGIFCGLCAVGAISWLAGWRVAVSLWAVALPVVMSFLVGVFFGLYPARQASRVDPIEALRHE